MQQEVAERRSPSSSSHSNKKNRETTRWSCRLSHRGDVYIVDKMKKDSNFASFLKYHSLAEVHSFSIDFCRRQPSGQGVKKVALSPSSSLSPPSS